MVGPSESAFEPPPNPRLSPQDIPPVPRSGRLPVDATSDLVAELHRGHALFEHGDIAADDRDLRRDLPRPPSIAEPWLYLGIARYTHSDVEEEASALRASLCRTDCCRNQSNICVHN